MNSVYGVLFVTSMPNEWFVTCVYHELFTSVCAMNGLWLMYTVYCLSLAGAKNGLSLVFITGMCKEWFVTSV